MRISRLVGCMIFFAVGWLWFPSGTGAVQTGLLCAGLGDNIWDQWHKGMMPKTDETIDKVTKIKRDCPQLAGSMDSIANAIKGEREKRMKAYGDVWYSSGAASPDEDLEDLELQR